MENSSLSMSGNWNIQGSIFACWKWGDKEAFDILMVFMRW